MPFLTAPASAEAAGIDQVLTLVHILMAVLFVGWSVYFVWVLWRFRSRRQPQPTAGAKGRVALGTEVGVVIAEAVLLIAFALPIWSARSSPRPAGANTILIRVVAEQFAWNVHYPGADGQFGATSIGKITASNPIGLDRKSPGGADDIVLLGEMHLPVNHPVIVQLSSKDVVHSFGVPAMRVKQDVIPGVVGSAWFTPTVAGEFEIACSQLCGLGHYRMRGVIIVESDADFRKFLAEGAARLR